MKLLRITLIALCLFSLSALAYSDTYFYLFSKGNFIASVGDEFDYELGENEFPLVSSHQNYGAGFGITFGKEAFFGIEGHYNLSGKVTLTDPSDNDTVEVDTYKYVSGFLTIGFNIVRSRSMRLYINGGGGISYYLDAKETKSYVSRLGIETEVEPPDKKYPLAGFGGVGLEIYISQSSGILFSGRYLFVDVEDPPAVFIGMIGFVYKF